MSKPALLKFLDKIVIVAVIYFLYMLAFYLPPCATPSFLHRTPPSSPKVEKPILCPNSENADFVMRHFLELQNKNLDSVKTSGKFIIYSVADRSSLGSRIPPLIASFLLALVTERGFLVHWPEVKREEGKEGEGENFKMPDFADLFSPPVPIDVNVVPGIDSAILNDPYATIRVDNEADNLLCTDLHTQFENHPFVIIKGKRPFFDLIFHNKFLAAKLHSLGLIRAVHELASCLLHPSPIVEEIIHKFYQDYPTVKEQPLIGVNVRYDLVENQVEQAALWDCVRTKYPPPHSLSPNRDGSAASFPISGNASIKYFMVSDAHYDVIHVPPDFQPYILQLPNGVDSDAITVALANIWILGNSSLEVFGSQGNTGLTAARVLFPTNPNMARISGNKIDKICKPVGELPCYKWWDIFKNQDSMNYSLSCFPGSATRKQIVLC